MRKQPLIIAHRGFSGRYPENTLAAIRAALAVGVDFVEIDVHETRDGELIVFQLATSFIDRNNLSPSWIDQKISL